MPPSNNIQESEMTIPEEHLHLEEEVHIWLSCQQFPPSVAKIRHLGIPIFFLLISIFMVVFGSIWLHFMIPICGTTVISSSKFTIRSVGTKRVMEGITCPGYDWTGEKTSYEAGAHEVYETIPLTPELSSTITPVGISSTEGVVGGPIGYTLNGVAIFSNGGAHHKDAVKAEGSTFDSCAGHNSPNFIWPGYYHYHSLPGDTSPNSHTDIATADITYCDGIKAWYNETDTVSHSPLMGFMVDGVPIYGPRNSSGMVPDDLDECGGHTDLGFYHYHFKTTYPYSVECLKGCIEMKKKKKEEVGHHGGHDHDPVLGSYECTSTGVTQYDYSSLSTMDWSYGTGNGSDQKPIAYPVCLIVFGILFMLISVWMMWKLNIVAYCQKSFRRIDFDESRKTSPVNEEGNNDYSALEVGEEGQDLQHSNDAQYVVQASPTEKI